MIEIVIMLGAGFLVAGVGLWLLERRFERRFGIDDE